MSSFYGGSEGTPGTPGEPGAQGEPGAPGVSVQSATITEDGMLVLIMSDGSEIEAGDVKGGPVGPKGDNGATFTPDVTDGVLTWTNDKELPNPEPYDFGEILDKTRWEGLPEAEAASLNEEEEPAAWGSI